MSKTMTKQRVNAVQHLCDIIDQCRQYVDDTTSCPYEYAAYIMVKHPDIIPKLMGFVSGKTMTKRQYSSLILKTVTCMREYYVSEYISIGKDIFLDKRGIH